VHFFTFTCCTHLRVTWLLLHAFCCPFTSDYRLPQLLRGRGIMVLNDELEGRVESGELILEGSEEEVETV
jgi:hypothetical protein